MDMYQDDLKERLLDASQERECEDGEGEASRRRSTSSSKILLVVTGLALALSLAGNLLLLHTNSVLRQKPDIGRSQFSGLGYDTPTVYDLHSEFSGMNATLADEMWETIDSSPIIVALTDEYAQEHGLEESVRFPWDESRGIYHIKAFHHLHCLKNMRKAYMDAVHGRPRLIDPEHVDHCMDTLRQDLMCLADDTPMPTVNKRHHIGNGQVRQCRNWQKLIEWTQEPERYSCYHMLDDYRTVPHSLEQFAYCKKDSEYYPVMEQYFREHGHRNPYGD